MLNNIRYQRIGYLSSLAARISALISSSVISGSWLDSTALRCCKNRSSALGCSSLLPLMVNGILRLLTTAFTKMLKAVFALMPNCSQSSSNCDFISESILTVTADCAITKTLITMALCHHFDGKITTNS